MQQHAVCAAVLLACAQAVTAAAQDAAPATVIVTATRFAETDSSIPANISVIDRAEIEASPEATLPDLLRSRAGIDVRTLSGPLATDATVDLRGFGDSAGSNTLILLDGQRLNAVDSSGIDWSMISLAAIDRVEILRGSGSILYGDRVGGGVINIVTRRPDKPEAQLSVAAGSYGYAAADARLAGKNGDIGINLSAHHARTDGWRQNSQAEQDSLGGRGNVQLARGEGFVDFSVFRESTGTPGALFTNQYRTQPTAARLPLDSQTKDGYRLRPGIALAIADGVTVEAEAAVTHASYGGRSFSTAGDLSFTSDRQSDNYSATPRLRWIHGLAGHDSESVIGIDYYDGRVDSATWASYVGDNMQRAKQTSEAIYLQNVTGISRDLDLTIGARSQRVRQQAEDVAAVMNSSATRSRTAWELGLSERLSQNLRLFGRSGRTFRFANTDELFGFDPINYATIFRGDIRPQQGRTHEIGGQWRTTSFDAQMSVYRQDLEDEIGYDSNAFINTNLPPTRRQGVEIDARWQLNSALDARLALTSSSATFRGGSDDGKAIPLVPRNKVVFGITWQGGVAGTWSALANWVDRRYFSGDNANAFAQMPAYATVDIKAAWHLAQWTVSARIGNLFDKRYATFAGYSSWYNDQYYYPAEPRSVFTTASYAFR